MIKFFVADIFFKIKARAISAEFIDSLGIFHGRLYHHITLTNIFHNLFRNGRWVLLKSASGSIDAKTASRSSLEATAAKIYIIFIVPRAKERMYALLAAAITNIQIFSKIRAIIIFVPLLTI
jgi:hypothetical protein